MIVDTSNRSQVQNVLERIFDELCLQDVLEMVAEVCFKKADGSLNKRMQERWDNAGRIINKLVLEIPTIF